jgi:hypothetical protein
MAQCLRLSRRWAASGHLKESLLETVVRTAKLQYPGHMVLTQNGRFFEIVGHDASRIAESTIPLRVAASGMVGFPVDAADNWLPIIQSQFKRLVLLRELPETPAQVSPRRLPKTGRQRDRERSCDGC